MLVFISLNCKAGRQDSEVQLKTGNTGPSRSKTLMKWKIKNSQR